MTAAAAAAIDAVVGRAIGHLERLVGFDTTSDRPNRPLIDYVAAVLADAGIAFEVLPALAAGGGRAGGGCAGGKAALIARFGADRPGGVILSGHTDTVPVDGQAWSADPFRLRRAGHRLCGRGTADMKGFIAAVLAMAPVLASPPPQRPLWLVLSYDEEVGCLAAPSLVPALLARAASPALAIVGEPSGMRVAARHRGIATFSTTVVGRAGHSGDPAAGANAIVAAAACIGILDRLAADLAAGSDAGEAATLNVGRIGGGTAINMIAGCCRFDWECRPPTGDGADAIAAAFAARIASEVLPSLRRRAHEARIDTEKRISVPPLTPGDAALVAWLRRLARAPRPATVPFTSEAGFFQQAGVAAVVCGPGEPAQAHQADEYIAVQQIARCVIFLHRLAESLPGLSAAPAEGLASMTGAP